MKKFFGGIFIEKKKLKEAGIEYPIKLEYYKVINEEKVEDSSEKMYGVNIVKTEYINNDIKVEEKTIKNLSSNEEKVNEILTILKKNEVTPICVQDIICDFSKGVGSYK